MKNNFENLWSEFKNELVNQVKLTNAATLEKAWKSMKSRTNFYTKDLFQRVAANLKLKISTELFKVDMVLSKTSSYTDVPLIFIESENSILSAEHEVLKLCSLSAPLKVLIICTDWDPDICAEDGKKSNRDEYTEHWESIIKSYTEFWKLTGVTGLIVAEWYDHLVLYAKAWNETGELFDKDHKIFVSEYYYTLFLGCPDGR
ncbi:MAG: hypothetical protein HY738_03120 [Bacteroidia bacterium]|nr:hypothetical protein [Bacteroidia bacterium]